MESVRPSWRSRTWIVATLALVLMLLLTGLFGVDDVDAVRLLAGLTIGLAALIVVWAIVRTRSERRRYEDELTAWSAEQAAEAERLRIARELHDLASHDLGLITVRAAVARRAEGSDAPAERADALTDIERISREATVELRRMLDVLRSPDPAPLHPADALEDLPEIVQQARDAGLEVDVRMDGVGELSAGVGLAVCAVVREGLANALRHAGPTRARVAITRAGGRIEAEVHDEGAIADWASRPGTGTGLLGLRERVAALSGTLEAAPARGGWTLRARIPDGTRA